MGPLKPEHKLLWVRDGALNGGIQARIATLDLMQRKMFDWLDILFEVRRLTEFEKYLKESTFQV